MGALTFFSYFFLGIGPGLSFFIFFIAQKSFLTLLTFFRKCMVLLEKEARDRGHRFVMLDKLYVALAWGYGHSVCHTVFFFLSYLSLTVGSGTFYIPTCPQMSLFLMGALYSLAFGMILSSVMVVAIEGYHTRNWLHVAYAPLVHFAAALVTLANLTDGGCRYAMPIDLGIGVLSVCYAGQMAWRKGICELKGGVTNEALLVSEQQHRQQGGAQTQGGEMQQITQPLSRQGSGTVRTRRGQAE